MHKQRKIIILLSVVATVVGFFLPWFSSGILSYIGVVKTVSLFTLQTTVFKLIRFAGFENMGKEGWVLVVFFSYWLIPILGSLSLVYYIADRPRKFLNTARIALIVTFILCIIPIWIKNSDDLAGIIIDTNYGYYITWIAAIIGIIVLFINQRDTKHSSITSESMHQGQVNNVDEGISHIDASHVQSEQKMANMADSVAAFTKRAKELSMNNLKSKSYREIGFLIIGIVTLLIMVMIAWKKEWHELVNGLIILAASGYCYLRLTLRVHADILTQIYTLRQHLKHLYELLPIPKWLKGKEYIWAYVAIGIMVFTIVVPLDNRWSFLSHSLRVLSGSGCIIFMSLTFIRGDYNELQRILLGFIGVYGIQYLRAGFVYKYIYLQGGISMLIYWIIYGWVNIYMEMDKRIADEQMGEEDYEEKNMVVK